MYSDLKVIWNDTNIRIEQKIQLLDASVFSILLYAADTWMLKKADEKRLAAFEMHCYRRLLRIRWQDFQTNESIRRQHTIVDTVRRRKLELFGHICRMPDNRTLKRVLFGAVEGRNYQGRPRKCWVNDILKWCNMTLQQASHHAQDRTTWRNLIAGPYGS